MSDQPEIKQTYRPMSTNNRQWRRAKTWLTKQGPQLRRYARWAARVYLYTLVVLVAGMVIMVLQGQMDSVFHTAIWYGYALPFVYFGAFVRWLAAPLIGLVAGLGSIHWVAWYLVGVPAVIIGLLVAILRKR